ncbi:MAG: YihY/virulence factor BrkB family protein [Saprospiraceae bacterium]
MKLPDIKKIKEVILQWGPVRALRTWVKEHSLPGFFDVPIYDVVIFLINETKRFDLISRANSIAFSFFLALFPTIIVIFTMVPFFSDYILSFFGFTTQHFLEVVQVEIRQVLPGEQGVGIQLYETIADLATKPRTDLLSIGFFLAIFFASNGMLAMMRSFDKSHLKTFKRRNFLRKRWIAIVLTLIIGLLSISSVLLIILGRTLIDYLSSFITSDTFATIGLILLRWLAVLGLVYFGIGVIYRYGAATYRKFSLFSPGTTLAASLSVLSSVVFSFYVDNYGAYSKIYGPIGTIIVVMLWIQLNAFAILVGFELNASIAVNRDLKAEVDEED